MAAQIIDGSTIYDDSYNLQIYTPPTNIFRMIANFQALTPTLYVKFFFFLGHGQMILLDFKFQDLIMVTSMSLRIKGAWSCPRKPVN